MSLLRKSLRDKPKTSDLRFQGSENVRLSVFGSEVSAVVAK